MFLSLVVKIQIFLAVAGIVIASACQALTVNLDGVELLDASCLVILCAVKRQANEKGKVLLLEGLGNHAVVPVIQNFRSKGNRLCRTYCGDRCLFD